MFRYRSARLTVNPHHAHRITDAVSDFLICHERKGDALSYLTELRSYLIGGKGKFCSSRMAFAQRAKYHGHFNRALRATTKN